MQETSETSTEIPYHAELLRKSLHLLALIIPAAMYYLGREVSLLILIPFSAFAVFIEFMRVRSAFVARYVDLIFARMMRPGERPAVGAPMVINGATWVLLSATLLTLIFPTTIASVSLGLFMICDAGAALVGRQLGKHHWGSSKKTIEGSVAFLLLAMAAFLILNKTAFYPLPVPQIILVSVTATILEVLPIRLNDNVFVPFCIAGLLFLIA